MVFCSNCGFNIVEESSNFCSKCGTHTIPVSEKIESNVDYLSQPSSIIPPTRSKWWYLLPIFFSVIGGVIAYFILRKDSPKLAMHCFIIGLILTVIGIAFSLSLSPLR